MPRVLLLSMPYGSLERPSMGLGLLQAQLHRRGIPCDTRYLAIEFAELVGVDDYAVALIRAAVHGIRRRLAVHRGALRAAAGGRRGLRRRGAARAVAARRGGRAAARAAARGVRAVPRAVPGERAVVALRRRRLHEHVRAEHRLARARATGEGAPSRRLRRLRRGELGGRDGTGAAPPLRVRRRRLLGRGRRVVPRPARRRSTRAPRRPASAASSTASTAAPSRRGRRRSSATSTGCRCRTSTRGSPIARRSPRRSRRSCCSRRRAAAGGARSRTARSAA